MTRILIIVLLLSAIRSVATFLWGNPTTFPYIYDSVAITIKPDHTLANEPTWEKWIKVVIGGGVLIFIVIIVFVCRYCRFYLFSRMVSSQIVEDLEANREERERVRKRAKRVFPNSQDRESLLPPPYEEPSAPSAKYERIN